MKTRISLVMICLISVSMFSTLVPHVKTQESGNWEPKTAMPTSRSWLAIGVVGSKLYAIGGENGWAANEEYDYATDNWVSKAPIPTPRERLAVGVVNGKIYAIGGDDGSGNFLSVNEEYDPLTNTWSSKAPMPTARYGHVLAVVNNKIYVIGGWNGQYLQVNEEYDPFTDTWATKAPMPTSRDWLSAGVINERIYAIGGENAAGSLTVNEEYDPLTNTWTNREPMPTARQEFAIGVMNNRIYVVGGKVKIGMVAMDTNEEYYPLSGSWTTRSQVPTARFGHAIGVLGGDIYAIGGYNSGYLNVNERFCARAAYLTDFVQLTTNPLWDRSPIWSPDGTQIAYFAFDSSSWYRHLWVMNPDGSGKTQLTFGNVIDETGEYSPDGTQIVFIRYQGGIFDLMMRNPDGTVHVFLHTSGVDLLRPRWSNDGQRIAFTYHDLSTDEFGIRMINVDGTNEVTLVSTSYRHPTCCWASDDSHLIYTLDDGIWRVDTTPPYQKTRLFSTILPTMHCEYSPNGEYILYASGVYGDHQNFYLCKANGDFIAQLTSDTTIEYGFEWSPDGQYIAFSSIRSSNTEIWRAKIVIVAQSDFEISVFPDELTAQPFSFDIEYQVTITSKNGFSSPVAFDADIFPLTTEMAWTFTPNPVTPPANGYVTSTLRIDVYDAPLKVYTITITATGGGITPEPVEVSLSVENSLEVPYQGQDATDWCGPTSLAMVLHYYNEIFHSWDYAEDMKLPTRQGVTMEALYNYLQGHFPHIMPLKGALDSKERMKMAIESNITAGFPVILGLGPKSPMQGKESGHAIVIVGFNETGFFVNDPSEGALAQYGITTSFRVIHLFAKWDLLLDFVKTDETPYIAVQGPSTASEYFGSIYPSYTSSINFHDPDKTDEEMYQLYPNSGLIWNHTKSLADPGENNNIIKKKCKGLFVRELQVSNAKSTPQSFTAYVDILEYETSQIVYSAPANEISNIAAFTTEWVRWDYIDMSQILEKGTPYQLGVYLYDSSGNPTDYFRSPPFYWVNGVKYKLSENQRHLYLHTYDEFGNHVGLNHGTGDVDLKIDGSYYFDDGNGTITVVVPQMINLEIVVDATYAEDLFEFYNLTVTVQTDLGVISHEYLGNITAGENQTFLAQISENNIKLAAKADMDFDPDILNLKSKGKWVTTYVELSGFNVSEIDVSTVLLNTTFAIDPRAPVTIGDHDNDTIPDLMIKFNRAALESYIYHDLGITYGDVTLTVTGDLTDGTPFEGCDTIRVVFSGDVNGDGVIDSTDLGVFGASWQHNPVSGVCDFNGDGAVDSTDYGLLATNYGATVP